MSETIGAALRGSGADVERGTGDGTTSRDIVRTLAEGAMISRRVTIVLICMLINAVDGFDVQVTAFTAPAIAAQWQLRPEALGAVLSAGLIGMGIGALSLSTLADIWGRRRIVLGSLGVVVLGMILAGLSATVTELIASRVITGIGIGGLISSVGTLVSEYCSDRRRGLVMGLMAVSFPAGAMICAGISIPLIAAFGWQSVFFGGAGATAAVLILAWWRLPESLLFLVTSPRGSAVPEANKILRDLKMPSIALGERAPAVRATFAKRYSDLLLGLYALRTAKLTVLFLCAMLTFYYLIGWAPKLVVQAGAPPAKGITIGLLINLGGMFGGVAAGLLIPKLGLVRAGRLSLLAMAVMVPAFGAFLGDMRLLPVLALIVGFTLWAVQSCIYTSMMIAFPAQVRATAVGLVTTGGRVGSALGPLLGGYLLGGGAGPVATSLILALPAVVAMLFIIDRPAPQEAD